MLEREFQCCRLGVHGLNQSDSHDKVALSPALQRGKRGSTLEALNSRLFTNGNLLELVMPGKSRLSVNPVDRQFFGTIAKKSKRSNQRRTRILQGDNEVSTVGIERLADIGF